MKQLVEQEIERIVNLLVTSQQTDGSWRYCFESGALTDAFMIFLLRSLKINDESLISNLAARIARLQQEDGAWSLYHDEGGNLSATIQAYVGLLYSKRHHQEDEHMRAAQGFILSRGGVDQADIIAKLMLALAGRYPWQHLPSVPIEVMLLPSAAPVHFFDLSGHARVHLAPMLILSDQTFTLQNEHTPDLSHLIVNERQRQRDSVARTLYRQQQAYSRLIRQWLQLLGEPMAELHQQAVKKAERFMLERIEADGTLYSYASATFLMIFALLALGYRKDNPVITKAVQGLKTLVCSAAQGHHLQNSTSTVWDTALISHALQTAGLSVSHPAVHKANHYILTRQHDQYGDWALKNPHVPPGGWGFSDINTINPDVDDTTAALRAIDGETEEEGFLEAWNRGLRWLLSMQNDDGGWPAFEKNTEHPLLALLPVDYAKDFLIDPSTADLTGRTLEFLGNHAGLTL
ncbi:sporulenol synthase [Caldalkalibacillus uzonensis]|uniref:Sporulenol synthase n=1 Tax=Caldalkalibacillus uzonensis TaxID=353224 RepID=A0ABU0CSH8_9BACI|nr:sporulenol synthase [Caldalkalibacillus uzonensis]